jgi:hypothetical protein
MPPAPPATFVSYGEAAPHLPAMLAINSRINPD